MTSAVKKKGKRGILYLANAPKLNVLIPTKNANAKLKPKQNITSGFLREYHKVFSRNAFIITHIVIINVARLSKTEGILTIFRISHR